MREAKALSVTLLNLLRFNSIAADIDPDGKGLKSQIKKANRSNARYTVIIGEDEVTENKLTIKNMSTGSQEKIKSDNILEYVTSHR